jgi:hypothetical protein
MVPMHLQALHKRSSDIYSVRECIGTVYTSMNSWKEAFNYIMDQFVRRQVCGFKRILRFTPPIKLTATI